MATGGLRPVQEMGGVDVHRATTEEAKIPPRSWPAPPRLDFNSLLTLITRNDCNTSLNRNTDRDLCSNWSWKWERIDFETSSIQCPKALNTLLGRRFSGLSPLGIQPRPCSSPSHGCTCNSHSHAKANDDSDHALDAIKSSLSPSTAIPETPSLAEQNEVGDLNKLRENVEDEELEEGQIPGEMAEEEFEDLTNNERGQVPDVSQSKIHYFGYDYGVALQNSIIVPQKTAMPKISEVKKKPSKSKKRRQNRKEKITKNARGIDQLPQKKKSGIDQLRQKEKSGDSKETLKTLETVDEKLTQEPVQPNIENEENRTAKENAGLSLSSFFESQIGLWTTETVDEVLRDTKETGNKKAKRGPLTAERKAKRKLAKRKKQALKDKEAGVKRLKLAPVTKSKPVILCKFYMKGRCAQGSQCSFSHDAVPATKSEICKYHVNQCCLKGDECPFSHDLSAFPCKFYHTRGYCLERDMCRFSHKPITENALQDLLKQSELEKQELHEQESIQGSIQHFVANNPQKLDEQRKFSVGDRSENVTFVEPSKSAVGNNQQISEERRDRLAFQNPGKGTRDGPSKTIFSEEEQISMEKGASLCVSNMSPIPKHNRLSYDLGAEGINDAFFEARKAALNALAAVADHDANLISRGLVRVPTFISSADPTANTDMDVDYLGSSGTGNEYVEAHKKSHGEHLVGGNHELPPSGLLNGSKSAIKMLEDLISGNEEFDIHSKHGNSFRLY